MDKKNRKKKIANINEYTVYPIVQWGKKSVFNLNISWESKISVRSVNQLKVKVMLIYACVANGEEMLHFWKELHIQTLWDVQR